MRLHIVHLKRTRVKIDLVRLVVWNGRSESQYLGLNVTTVQIELDNSLTHSQEYIFKQISFNTSVPLTRLSQNLPSICALLLLLTE